jgi:hypothetical protein
MCSSFVGVRGVPPCRGWSVRDISRSFVICHDIHTKCGVDISEGFVFIAFGGPSACSYFAINFVEYSIYVEGIHNFFPAEEDMFSGRLPHVSDVPCLQAALDPWSEDHGMQTMECLSVYLSLCTRCKSPLPWPLGST